MLSGLWARQILKSTDAQMRLLDLTKGKQSGSGNVDTNALDVSDLQLKVHWCKL